MPQRMGCLSSSRKPFRRGYAAGRRLTSDISERTSDRRNYGSEKNRVLRVVVPCLRVLLVCFDTPRPRRLFCMLTTETQCFSPFEFSVLSAPKNPFKLDCVNLTPGTRWPRLEAVGPYLFHHVCLSSLSNNGQSSSQLHAGAAMPFRRLDGGPSSGNMVEGDRTSN